jgi:NAD(P)H-dependent flavin oxidoreductase YrpB (nitropropane dioxygenase family)
VTAFTELVGCTVPIQLAPMGGVVGADLVAAVVEAGGMGMVATGGMPAPAVVALLDEVGRATSGPFGVNFLIPFVAPDAVEAASTRCRLVDFYYGPPDEKLVEIVHAGGALAGWQVGSVADACAAAAAGCDLLVARGIEGGGRMYGALPLWPLLFEILDTVDIPVLAAGGIGTGRGLAAALAAGAAGVRMGTRFLATAESLAHPEYQQAVIRAGPAETALTDAFSVGWPGGPGPARVLTAALEAARAAGDDTVGEMAMGATTVALPRFAPPPPVRSTTGNIAAMAMYAGQSVGAVEEVEPAGVVVRAIAEEAQRLLTGGPLTGGS